MTGTDAVASGRARAAAIAVTVAAIGGAAVGLLPVRSQTAAAVAPSATSGAAPSSTTSAPGPTVTASTAAGTTTTSTTTSTATVSPTATTTAATAGRFGVAHVVLAPVDVGSTASRYGPTDAELTGVQPFATVRVRFQLRNVGAGAGTIVPRLEYRRSAGTAFAVVPEEPVPDVPFHLDREWLPDGPGTALGAPDEVIPVGELRIRDARPGETREPGHHTMAGNPDRPLMLPAGGVTEEEFTLRVTLDAPASTRYELRLTDDGTPLGAPAATATSATATSATATSAATGSLVLGPRDQVQLSAGQRDGTAVGEAQAPAAPATSAAGPGGGARYALRAASAVLATTAVPSAHGPGATSGDRCLTCHGTHNAQGSALLRLRGPQSTQCFTCHDGTGASGNVRQQYTDSLVPANDAASGAYYSHDASAGSTHTLASENEFGGVLNRHSECGDCHNAHRASSTATTQTTNGWTASGRLAGISGAAVVNGPAGTAPTYTFLDGLAAPVTYEYQLCLTCHSGFTTLRSNSGLPPSRYALDKGTEFNPANASYHPVEAMGTNQTTKMADSLSGTSPYKLWNFTTSSTVRCTHCHAGGPATGATTIPQDADLSVHGSPNRGILLRPYRDQVLTSSGEAYAAADFALCYTCHAEAPFVASGSTATNFRYHGKHVSGIAREGSGSTDVDTAGAGQGNALCAECHYRLHGSSSSYGTQTSTGARLVNFAPDVTAAGDVLTWTRSGSGGSCTLVCHGEHHQNVRY